MQIYFRCKSMSSGHQAGRAGPASAKMINFDEGIIA
jgi:hypothetical protein